MATTPPRSPPSERRRHTASTPMSAASHGIPPASRSTSRAICIRAPPRRATWYGMRFFGHDWHTTRGIRIGSPVAAVRRLYPTATLDKATGRLDLVTRRDEELRFVLLAVQIADGKVTAIDAPAAFVY